MSLAPARRRDDEVLLAEIGKIVSIVAARFRRGWKTLEKVELEAEGWQACLAAISGYDPAAGPAEAYFRVVARRAMGRFCSRMVACVSMGKKVAEGRNHQGRVDVFDEQAMWEPHRLGKARVDETPEMDAADREEAARRERVRVRVRVLLDRALAGWSDYDRFVVERLHGLDGHRAETPRELAERIQARVRSIYKIQARATAAIWRVPDLYRIHKELLDAETSGEG